MKTGILLVVVICLVGLSGWLFYDNSRLQKTLEHEKQLALLQASTSKVPDPSAGELAATSALLADARSEILRLKNEMAFPVRINTRKATAGGGYSVEIFNGTKQFVSVDVTFSNAARKTSKALNFDLGPGFSRDVGKIEGWTAAAGDVLQVECPGFLPVTGKLD